MYVAAYVFEGQTPVGQTALAKRLSCLNGLVQASTAESLTQIINTCPTRIGFTQLMVGATNMVLPDPSDVQAIVTFAQSFATAAIQGKKALLSFATTGYEHLGAFQSISAQHAFANITTNRDTFDYDITSMAIALRQLQNQAGAIQAVYSRYGGFDDALLVSRSQDLTEGLGLLRAWVDAVEANPTSLAGTTQIVARLDAILRWGMPTLNYSVSTPVTWGGLGGVAGTSFTDIATESPGASSIPIAQFPVLTSLNANGNLWLNGIQCSYIADSQTGPETISHGTPLPTNWAATPLQLDSGEFITSVSGTAGWYVNQLQITTSKNQQWSYPPAPQYASSFTWTVPEGSTLIGFQGVAGQYLNALGPIVIRFQPAIWVRWPNPVLLPVPIAGPRRASSRQENGAANATALFPAWDESYAWGSYPFDDE